MPTRPTDPLLALQWYIDGSMFEGGAVDLNVLPVWDDYTGRGVHIGIYDGLVETTHVDLDSNYNPILTIPGLPTLVDLGHGTAVAGIIAAEANGEGVVGIAHGATFTSVAIADTVGVSDAAIRLAMPEAYRFDVVMMNYAGTVAFDPNLSAAAWAPLSAGYIRAAAEGRGGLGTILVTAAGNNRTDDTNSGMSRYQAERHTIVASAVGRDGVVANYSSEGANVLVATPSSASFTGDVATTDLSGNPGYNLSTSPGMPADYTDAFGGTSSSAPMTSAIAALILEANPELGWRDVREIMALSARHTGSAIGAAPAFPEKFSWTVNHAMSVNGGGLHFSNDYGFGLIDALVAVRLAESWTQVQTSANEVSTQAATTTPVALPDGQQIIIPLTVTGAVDIETVTLDLNIAYGSAIDLDIRLVSPSGTESVLFLRDAPRPSIFGITTPFRPWTFLSNAFLGEEAAGTWQIVIRDLRVDGGGTFNSATLTAYGSAPTMDDTYIYTNEFGVLAGVLHSTTLVDADGGVDTLNAAAVSTASIIDLRAGQAGSVNGQALTIAVGSLIENAIGGDGADRIVGNSASNHLRGARGNDSLYAGHGTDTLDGGAGADLLVGGTGDNWLDGGDGNDILRGAAGSDTLLGGTGIDTASYADATAAVAVNLARTTAQQTGGGGLDTLREIESVSGTAFADRLTGNGEANTLSGLAGNDTLTGGLGNDTLVGGAGADRLDGGDGIDTASYATAIAGITVDLSAGIGSGGDAAGDRLFNIEALFGGTRNDALAGNAAANRLSGGTGADTLSGGLGLDTLTGGGGDDVFRFATSPDATNVDLIVDFASAAVGNNDALHLDDLVFAGLTDPATQFVAGARAVATTADHHLVYDTVNGHLYYDADGAGGVARVLFAKLSGAPTLSAADIVVV